MSSSKDETKLLDDGKDAKPATETHAAATDSKSETASSQALKQGAFAYVYVLTWMTISIGLILYNKWLLAFSGFPYPVALTLWHMIFCSFLGFLSVKVFGISKPISTMTSSAYRRRVIPIGVLYAASLWLSNAAYLHISVSLIQMTKALMPGLVYAVGIVLANEHYKFNTSMNMVVIAIGVAIAAYGEINFVWIGVIQQLSALLFEATRLSLIQVLINSKGMKMNPLQSLYYLSPACGVALLAPFFIVEWPRMRTDPDIIIRPLILLGNAVVAFALNLAVFLLIGKTSALTMNIAGVIKDWILIFSSSLLFNSPITALNLIGYFMAFLAVAYYNYSKYQDMKSKAAAGDKGIEKEDAAKSKDIESEGPKDASVGKTEDNKS